MSMFSDFLRTLKPNELERIKSMNTTAREKAVLLTTLQQIEETETEDDRVRQVLYLSKTHFDKINSLLLDKAYKSLTDGSDSKVLYLLWEKSLKTILLHEIKVREKKTLRGPKKKLAEYYRLVFGICIRLPVLNGKIKLAEHYGKKYLAALSQPNEEQQFEVWLQYFFSTIFYYSSNGKMKEFSVWTSSEIKKWQKKLIGKKYAVCNFFLHLCEASYYEYYTADFPNLLTALQNCLCEYRHGAERVGLNYKIYVETKLANAYCHGSYFAEGLKIYRDAFDKYEEQLLRNRYHPLMFSVVAMLNGKYDEAQKMMDTHLLPLLKQTPNDSFNFDIERNYAVLYMHKGDLKKAGKYIQQGQRWDKTQFNFLGDVLQRVVNNTYYLLLNDLETSLSLARKNIRFLNSKPQDGITGEYKIPFLVIQDIIRQKQGKKTSQQFNLRLRTVQQGLMKLYGSLLLKANKS